MCRTNKTKLGGNRTRRKGFLVFLGRPATCHTPRDTYVRRHETSQLFAEFAYTDIKYPICSVMWSSWPQRAAKQNEAARGQRPAQLASVGFYGREREKAEIGEHAVQTSNKSPGWRLLGFRVHLVPDTLVVNGAVSWSTGATAAV